MGIGVMKSASDKEPQPSHRWPEGEIEDSMQDGWPLKGCQTWQTPVPSVAPSCSVHGTWPKSGSVSSRDAGSMLQLLKQDSCQSVCCSLEWASGHIQTLVTFIWLAMGTCSWFLAQMFFQELVTFVVILLPFATLWLLGIWSWLRDQANKLTIWRPIRINWEAWSSDSVFKWAYCFCRQSRIISQSPW